MIASVARVAMKANHQIISNWLKRATRLIADVFADFDRLLAEPERAPGASDAGS
jgi:hypothetical protein